MVWSVNLTDDGTGKSKGKTDELLYVNPDIMICLICGDDKIEFHEFGISCEECRTLSGRSKY